MQIDGEPADPFDPSGAQARWVARDAYAARQPERPLWERSYEAFDLGAQVQDEQPLPRQSRVVTAGGCVSCAIPGWDIGTAPGTESYQAQTMDQTPSGWELPGSSGGAFEQHEIDNDFSSVADADTLLGNRPPAADQILEFVSPYLGPLTEALAPLLAAHGLSAVTATTADVLAIAGLADEVVTKAQQIVARVNAIEGLSPHEISPETGPYDERPFDTEDGPIAPLDLSGTAVPGWDVMLPPVASVGLSGGGSLPAGWGLGREGPRQAFRPSVAHCDGLVVWVPDRRGRPVCVPRETEFDVFKCNLNDIQFVRAEERLRSARVL